MELQAVKDFLRVDHNDDDELISTLMKAAEEYCGNAGVKADYDSSLYCLAIQMLVTHWYENRTSVTVGNLTRVVEMSLVNILSQLKAVKR